MKRYVLKKELDGQPVHDGVFPGLGIIQHGESYAPSYPAQEEQVRADPRFEEDQPTPETPTTPAKGKGGSK